MFSLTDALNHSISMTIVHYPVPPAVLRPMRLKARHSFSFGSWHDPQRVHFAFRVLNDDLVAGGTGFGKHPHDNMEIITIPLTGARSIRIALADKA